MNSRVAAAFRLLKIAVAVGLLALSLWALLLPPIFPVSTRSIVNAKAIRLEAGRPGRVVHLDKELRRRVSAGARIASITTDQNATRREIDALGFSLETLRGQLGSLDETVAIRRKDVEDATRALEVAEGAIRRSLARQLADARSKLSLYAEHQRAMVANRAQLAPLFRDAIITQAQWHNAVEREIEAKKTLLLAQNELARIEAEQANLAAGVVVAEDHGAEGIRSRIAAYREEIRGLEVRRVKIAADVEMVERQIGALEAFLAADESLDLLSPVDGVVWRQSVLDGQLVLEGQEIVQIADENSVFVEADLGRPFLDSVSLGDVAHVYLVNDQRFVEGRVRDIQVVEHGKGSGQIINSVPHDASILKLVIDVPGDALTTSDIGQLAKVMVSSARPGIVERTMVWLSFLLRSHAPT